MSHLRTEVPLPLQPAPGRQTVDGPAARLGSVLTGLPTPRGASERKFKSHV